MTMNIRAANNWKKTTNKIRSYQALSRKSHGKSYIPSAIKGIFKKVDKIINGLSRDHREMLQINDIFDMLSGERINLDDDEKLFVSKYLREKYDIDY